MKTYCFLLFFAMLCLSSIGQSPFVEEKRDYVWLTGYSSNPDFPSFGGTLIDFNSDTITLSYEYREMDFDAANASICDNDGNLLFYTNGIYVANKEGGLMENGDSLNFEPNSSFGYILTQGVLIIPKPESENLYYLFHQSKDWFFGEPNVTITGTELFYSIIDINQNDGLGKVIEKSISLKKDTLDIGKITAIRHANGRDWWLSVAEHNEQQFYRFLISPAGIESYGLQAVENADIFFSGLGQSVFSPDGSKYIRLSLHNIYTDHFIDIYDFDRCTGEFFNPIQITYIDTAYSGGVAISPNNRYLYVSSFKYVYQYDLEADDIESSRETVAVLDGFQSPFFTTFFLAQLAPDNKIYINCNNTVDYMHVIHNPNAGGVACQMEQHGLQLPTLNAFSMPNNPYFRLGPLDGSPCDTLGWDNHPQADFYTIVADTAASFWDYSLFAPTEWEWDFGDGSDLSFEQNPQHIFTESGVYEVCLTVSNENASDTSCEWIEIIITDTHTPVSLLKHPKIFPNPAKEYFFFSYYSEKEGICTLYDTYGRLVRQRPLLSGNVTQAWEVEGLASGMYYLEVKIEGESVLSEKVVILG